MAAGAAWPLIPQSQSFPAMCGRFALHSDSQVLARRFDVPVPDDILPRYNLAPTQTIPIVRREASGRHVLRARWGLIPSWAKDMNGGYSTFNARAETVAEKPSFRAAFRHRRCLIPADGYYEWQAVPGMKAKQPFFIALRERVPMALAGLWECWRGPAGDTLESCSILVTTANELTGSIHERMPVILAPSAWDFWLDPEQRDSGALQALLKPYPALEMVAWKVGTWVNDPRHEGAECIAPLETPDESFPSWFRAVGCGEVRTASISNDVLLP